MKRFSFIAAPRVSPVLWLLVLLLGWRLPARADEASVYADGPKIGDPAPPLHLVEVINGPMETATNWNALRGKVVVLDFWATWCMPCVVSIPHMNKLVDELKNDPVQFIAITSEPENVVTNFLKNNPFTQHAADLEKANPAMFKPLVETFAQASPIHAWIGLDDLTGHAPDDYYAGNTVSGYYFSGVPHCVVVDKEGRIAAYAHPRELNAAFLRAIAAGEHPPVPEPEDLAPNELKAWRAEVLKRKMYTRRPPRPATYEVSIQRSQEWLSPKTGGWFGTSANQTEFRLYNSTLTGALNSLQQSLPELRFEVLSPLPTERYDFRFNTPTPLFAGLLEQTLRLTFDLDVGHEKTETEIYLVKAVQPTRGEAIAGAQPKATPVPATTETFTITDIRANLVYFAQQRFGKTLVNQGDLDRSTTNALTLNKAVDFDGFQQAVRAQLGMELVPAKQTIQVMKIRARTQ